MIGVTELAFDTTGTAINFCPECEHAPCVGGRAPRTCTMRPRFIVTHALRVETFALLDAQFHNPLAPALTAAVWALSDSARPGGRENGDWLMEQHSAEALNSLGQVRDLLKGFGPVSALAKQAADALNQHGKFTARLVEHEMAVEIRYADSGELLTTLWEPGDDEKWTWHAGHTGAFKTRTLDSGFRIEQVVRIVATSLLDERRSTS